MRRDQRLELRHELCVAAERELRIDPLLKRSESELLEPLHFNPGEWLELEIRQCSSPPQRLGFAQKRRGGLHILGLACSPRLVDEPLERVQVKFARRDVQQVPG